jgi:hypothetical protein
MQINWFLGSSILFFLLDLSTNPCFLQLPIILKQRFQMIKLIQTYLFLFIHHLIAIFLYFGWLFSSPYILGWYIIFVLGVMLHWITNKQKCILTQVLNRVCEYSDAEPFHDIWYFLGLKSKPYTNLLLVCYLFIGIIIAFYKISKYTNK